MSVCIELPAELEIALRRQMVDLDRAAKEALLVDLYRQSRVTAHELATALGIDRFAADESPRARAESNPQQIRLGGRERRQLRRARKNEDRGGVPRPEIPRRARVRDHSHSVTCVSKAPFQGCPYVGV